MMAFFNRDAGPVAEQRLGRGLASFVLALVSTAVLLLGAAPSWAAARSEVKPEIPTFQPKDVPVKWEGIPARSIRLFYPGQASWDRLVNPQKDFTHLGGPVEEPPEKKPAPKGPAEDKPIPGKRPTVDLAVKAAYDAQNMYFWLQWESEEPGAYHNAMRFDGKKWVGYGGFKPDKSPRLYEDRLTFLPRSKQGAPRHPPAGPG